MTIYSLFVVDPLIERHKLVVSNLIFVEALHVGLGGLVRTVNHFFEVSATHISTLDLNLVKRGIILVVVIYHFHVQATLLRLAFDGVDHLLCSLLMKLL